MEMIQGKSSISGIWNTLKTFSSNRLSVFLPKKYFFENCKGDNITEKSEAYDKLINRGNLRNVVKGEAIATHINEQCPHLTTSDRQVRMHPCSLLESWEHCAIKVLPVSLEVCKEAKEKNSSSFSLDPIFASSSNPVDQEWLKDCKVAECLAKDCDSLPPSVRDHAAVKTTDTQTIVPHSMSESNTTVEASQEVTQEPVVSTANASAVLGTAVAAANITSSLCGAFLVNASNLIAGNESSNNQTADCLSQEINAYNHDNSLLYMSVIGGTAVFLTALGGIACAIKSYQDNQRRAAYQEVMKSTGV
ncbi:MAG: hypothetical protein AAHH96_07020 [Candidatus Symbiodolus clandestinus]